MSEDPKQDRLLLLEEAIKKRDELNIFIKVLQEMTGTPFPSVAKAPVPSPPDPDTPFREGSDPISIVHPGMFFGKSQVQSVKILLERVLRPLKMTIILKCLEKGGLKVGGKNPGRNLWGTLNKSDTFILVPKAGWSLAEWYPASVVAKYRKEAEGTEGKEENGNGEEKDKDKEKELIK